jgi:hypothetical protein
VPSSVRRPGVERGIPDVSAMASQRPFMLVGLLFCGLEGVPIVSGGLCYYTNSASSLVGVEGRQ